MNPRSVQMSICMASAFFAMTAADSAAQLASQNLDAVCKSAPMPAGYVPVGEIDSPECTPEAPPKKNAWLIDKVRDKIVSCARPDYEDGYPPAIGYVVCKRVSTSACPIRLDGSPNGFELAKGASCDGPNMTSLCFDYTDENPQPSMTSFTWQKDWTIQVQRGAEKCKGPQPGYAYPIPDNHIGYSLERETVAPFCIDPNVLRLRENISRNFRKLKYNNMSYAFSAGSIGHPFFDAVIRVYHDESCPDYPQMGQLNAMVVKRHSLTERGKEVAMCNLTFRVILDDGNVDDAIDWLIQQKDFERRLPMKEFHDDRCGLGTGTNALKLTLPNE